MNSRTKHTTDHKKWASAILFQCHAVDSVTLNEFHRLSREMRQSADVILVYHAKDGCLPKELRNLKHYIVNQEKIERLGYPRFAEGLIPGSAHFPLLLFNLENPSYRNYWLIEYDVRFTGSWRTFFRAFEQRRADFIASHIHPYVEQPRWGFWNLRHPSMQIPMMQRIRSFNPVYRISSRAVKFLHACHRSGWCGHFEVLIPTMLNQGGFRLSDLGGTGPFSKRKNLQDFYVEGTNNAWGLLEDGSMRYRPAFKSAGDEKNKLYHPIKQNI